MIAASFFYHLAGAILEPMLVLACVVVVHWLLVTGAWLRAAVGEDER